MLKAQPQRFVSLSTFNSQVVVSTGFPWLTCSPLPPREPSLHCSPSILYTQSALSTPVMKQLTEGLWLQLSTSLRSDCEISNQEQISGAFFYPTNGNGRWIMDGQRMDVLPERCSPLWRRDRVASLSCREAAAAALMWDQRGWCLWRRGPDAADAHQPVVAVGRRCETEVLGPSHWLIKSNKKPPEPTKFFALSW